MSIPPIVVRARMPALPGSRACRVRARSCVRVGRRRVAMRASTCRVIRGIAADVTWRVAPAKSVWRDNAPFHVVAARFFAAARVST